MAGENIGVVYIFEKKNDMNRKRILKNFLSQEIHWKISSIIMSSGEENIILGIDNG